MTELPETDDDNQGGAIKSTLLGCLAAVAVLAALIGLYLAFVWVLGLLPHPELGVWHYAGGAALTIVVAAAVLIVGESVIEDVVKFVFIAIGAAAVWSIFGPGVSVVYWGTAVGASSSLILRMTGMNFR
jgi:hypothetical protein